MRKAIIIYNCDNESLLRFTQTKLFFNAINNGINFVNDCITVSSLTDALKEARSQPSVVLEVGDFLTTKFREKNKDRIDTIVISENPDGVIKFDLDKPINFQKRYYAPPSKQCYIIENLLKCCIKSRKLIWLDNTETLNNTKLETSYENFYGLSSGWKSVYYALNNNFKNITVYDNIPRQLELAKMLHSKPKLPEHIVVEPPVYGDYNPPEYIKENWNRWHKMSVTFKEIDLLEDPEFDSNSFIWVSNAFHYEPTMFKYGYDVVKDKFNKLLSKYKDSKITT